MTIRSFQGVIPKLGKNVFIDPTAVVLGDVELGDGVSVWPMAVIRGDMHSIRIGSRTSVQDGAVLHITHSSEYNPGGFPLTIGEDVTIGHKVTLHGCTLGNRILVGIGAIVLDGVLVEDEVVIAAGTLVPPGKVLRSGYVYAGNPARELRAITDKERSSLSYSAASYVNLQSKCAAEGWEA